jgi:hypothetical protein
MTRVSKEEKLHTWLLLKNGRAIWETTGPMMRFFKRRKAAYQTFVEKQAGPLEKLLLLSCSWGCFRQPMTGHP